jgi:hypothetical protein
MECGSEGRVKFCFDALRYVIAVRETRMRGARVCGLETVVSDQPYVVEIHFDNVVENNVM